MYVKTTHYSTIDTNSTNLTWPLTLLFLVVLASLTFICHAQVKEPATIVDDKVHLNVTFQPLFLLNSAFKFDLELRQGNHKLSFIGGMELYNGSTRVLYGQRNNFGETTADRIKGYGINLALKYKISTGGKASHFYFNPGVVLRSFDMKLIGPMFYSYVENNVEYITYGTTEATFKISPFLVYGNFGYHYITDGFILDLYTGIGYKKSQKIEEVEQIRNYEDHFYGYNHNGIIVQAGLKFGFQIR